ncbi:MAG TPA: sortase [Patescibacteria group bacterium]
MNKYVYKKPSFWNAKKIIRFFGLVTFLVGLSIVFYVFSPLIIWQITLAPAFADQDITAPIPNHSQVTASTITSLFSTGFQSLSGVDFTDASNWYPHYDFKHAPPREASYFLSIPKLNITNASVSTTDTDLSKHLVNLAGTSVPPDKGNTVIFGHSTLPQLFNPKDYKTILANAHTLLPGDIILANVNGITYTYKIFSITVVEPDDTSVLSQTFDDSYLTLITCTPPGTIWKRLIVKSRLQKLQ